MVLSFSTVGKASCWTCRSESLHILNDTDIQDSERGHAKVHNMYITSMYLIMIKG